MTDYGPDLAAEHTPPNGAVYVDGADGDDHADGTLTSPLRTIVKATERVPPDGYIALNEIPDGYPEQVPGVWHKGFTLASLPGHRAVLRGSEHDQPPAPFVPGQHHRSNNRTTHPDHGENAEPMPPAYRVMLQLPEAPPVNHRGWFGPEYLPPTPPEEPTVYDLTPLNDARDELGEADTDYEAQVLAVVAELRRVEADLVTCEAERQAHAEGRWILALHVNDLNDQLAELATRWGTAQGERDQALADLATRTAELAECMEGHEPELRPVLFGGSHPQGYVAGIKTLLGGAPQVWRRFSAGPALTVADLDSIEQAYNDGGIAAVSPQRGTAGMTSTNAQALRDRLGPGSTGIWTNVHEPTQKMTGLEYVAMVNALFPIVRNLLPEWDLTLCFQAWDFNDAALDRHPIRYLAGLDWTLVDSISVDVYDKGNATDTGDGKHLPELLQHVEAFAVMVGRPINILEYSAPDTGQRPGVPPASRPRRAGWKPEALFDAWEHVTDIAIVDGQRLYRSLLIFNGFGPDAPAAVPEGPGQPAIPQGWTWSSTPEAQAAARQVRSEALLQPGV
jgi:hypothetical protein